MLATIISVEQDYTVKGAEFLKVNVATADGKQTTKAVFDNLKDKWPLLVEGATLEFKMEQKGQFWNVVDIIKPELQTVAPTPPFPKDQQPKTSPKAQQQPKPGDDPTRKSIERQTALKASVEIAVARINQGKEMDVGKVLTVATLFESYLEHGAIVKEP